MKIHAEDFSTEDPSRYLKYAQFVCDRLKKLKLSLGEEDPTFSAGLDQVIQKTYQLKKASETQYGLWEKSQIKLDA